MNKPNTLIETMAIFNTCPDEVQTVLEAGTDSKELKELIAKKAEKLKADILNKNDDIDFLCYEACSTSANYGEDSGRVEGYKQGSRDALELLKSLREVDC